MRGGMAPVGCEASIVGENLYPLVVFLVLDLAWPNVAVQSASGVLISGSVMLT